MSNHSRVACDQKPVAVEFFKDRRNGVDQVLLRSSRGASALVRSLFICDDWDCDVFCFDGLMCFR